MSKPTPTIVRHESLRPLAVWMRSSVLALTAGVLAFLVSLALGSPLFPSMILVFVMVPAFVLSVAVQRLGPVRKALSKRQLERDGKLALNAADESGHA